MIYIYILYMYIYHTGTVGQVVAIRSNVRNHFSKTVSPQYYYIICPVCDERVVVAGCGTRTIIATARFFSPCLYFFPSPRAVSNSNHVVPVKNLSFKVLPAGLAVSYRNMIYCPTLFENLTKRNLFISSYILYFFSSENLCIEFSKKK